MVDMMEWGRLISTKRFGQEHYFNAEKHDGRSEFQRDFDRMIFSPAFRRLQNKTQVFPLPGSVFVHNRLTHSLEVSSIGRSIGSEVANRLKEKYGGTVDGKLDDIGAVVAVACLAHDLGNPPFGHSGENAIAAYFSEGDGRKYRNQLNVTDEEWADFEMFEGNANAFRLLTNQFVGRRSGGFVLTYSTLASIVKYPYEARYADRKKQKFGFFQSEKESYSRIAEDLGIVRSPYNKDRFARHPLVYLVEAADDICYQIMDMEDAYKLRIISYEQVERHLMAFMSEAHCERTKEIFKMVIDDNERLAYIRSTVMGILVDAVCETFVENEDAILRGEFMGSLIDNIKPSLAEAYKASVAFSVKNIYKAQMVVDIELAGYKIITLLLDSLLNAVFEPEKNYSKQLLRRIPMQYDVYAESDYLKVMSVLDYISGMTDLYALDLYRKINGTSLPTL